MAIAWIVKGPGAIPKVGSLVLHPFNECWGVSVPNCKVSGWDPALRGILALCSPCYALCVLSACWGRGW